MTETIKACSRLGAIGTHIPIAVWIYCVSSSKVMGTRIASKEIL